MGKTEDGYNWVGKQKMVTAGWGKQKTVTAGWGKQKMATPVLLSV